MEVIITWITENLVNGLISLLIFAVGVGLGVVVFSFALRFLKNGKAKTRKKTATDIEPFVDGVIDDFLQEKVKIGREKLTQLLTVVGKLFEEIPKNYKSRVKYYEVLKAKDYACLENDLKISLDFSVDEGICFLRATVDALKDEIYLLLDSSAIKAVYGVGRVFNFFARAGEVTKKPEDMLIAEVLEIIDKLSNPNDKIKKEILKDSQEKSNFIKKGIEKIMGKIKGGATTLASNALDDYLKDFIREFAQLINLLYSDGFKEDDIKEVSQSTSVKEIA